jgi:hypothetical protein
MQNRHIFSAESVPLSSGMALLSAWWGGYNRDMVENPYQSPEALPGETLPNHAANSVGRSRVIFVLRGLTILACIPTAFCVLMTVGWLLIEQRRGLPPQRSLVTLITAVLSGSIAAVIHWLCKRISRRRPSNREQLP